jgi:hypothetical protein
MKTNYRRGRLVTTLSFLAIAAAMPLAGCGSNWRMHQAELVEGKPSSDQAPAWVSGTLPQSEDRVYFIGRSHTPDLHRDYAGERHDRFRDGEWSFTSARVAPHTRVGYTVMDERDAVQSARNDIYDQIRQRLSPRNMGTTGQLVQSIVDVGACLDCGTSVPAIRTSPQSPCNEPCLRSGATTWPNTASQGRCGSCTATAVSNGIGVNFVDVCGACGRTHTFRSAAVPGCDTCPVQISATAAPWGGPSYPDYSEIMSRDVSIVNVGVDSVMPALLANVQEDQVYFEKWHIHEGHDRAGRPFAEGRDEWMSFKCWMLMSIPRAEYQEIVAEFRGRYATLLATSMSRDSDDRARRVQWETAIQDNELKLQSSGRSGVVFDYYDNPQR